MSRFNFVKEFLNLSKTEKAGIWLLLSILIITLLLSVLLRERSASGGPYDFSEYRQQIAGWESQTTLQTSKAPGSYVDLDNPRYSEAKSRLTPYEFNPNDLDAEGWKKMGFSDKQVSSIMKYRQKGGEFRTKSDLAKMYTISEEEFAVLEPYIQLPEQKQDHPQNTDRYEKKEAVRVELNSADSTALVSVKGIGPAYARRILQYRRKLHGFVDLRQLLEVKDMTQEKLDELTPSLFVNPYLVQKMNINTVTFDELKNHPYFGYNIALSLINYRKQHGPYSVLTDIKKSALITEEVFAKISPYLTIQ